LNGYKKFLSFDQASTEFELLETEHGVPQGWLGGQKGKQRQKQSNNGRQNIAQTVDENIEWVKQDFRSDINPDVIIRQFILAGQIKAAAVFISGMADATLISDYVLRQGMRPSSEVIPLDGRARYAGEHIFVMQELEVSSSWETVTMAICEGRTVVFLDGAKEAVIMDTRGFASRGVETAQNEKVVFGAQEGFNENLRTNITLLRRIIKKKDFVCEFRDAGGENHTRVVIAYCEEVVNQSLLEEVKRRLASVETRKVVSSGIVEQLTEQHSFTPLPQVLSTERPDRVASLVMEGHVAVLLEGSPLVNVMPVTMFALMNTSEDVNLRIPAGNVLRLVRYFGAVLSIILPGYFLAMTLHHQGLLSAEVLNTIVESRKMVFWSMGTEVLFLLIVFQLVREAGMRVPGAIGQAIGIIGGLIMGQAAVAANVVSTITLIIVALTGLGNFTIPDYSLQLAASEFRIILALAAWLGGLLGMFCTALIIVAHMASLKSYGVPFFAPAAPKTYSKRPMILRGKIQPNIKTSDFTNSRRREI